MTTTNSQASSSNDGNASRAFERLHEKVRSWIYRQEWKQLRDAQELAIPVILDSDSDLIIAAATAAGKTEAAFLPIVSQLVERPAKSIGTLYIAPLKALINDQFRRIEELCDELDVPVHRWHGDVSAERKRDVVRNPNGILLITPESLEALFVLRGHEVKRLFNDVSAVVVDEMHAFLEGPRGAQLRSLLHRLELVVRRRVRRIGLSATLGDMSIAADYLRPRGADDVRMIISKHGGQEIRIQVRGYVVRRPLKTSDDEIDPAAAYADICRDVFDLLRGRNNLVFANSRSSVEMLADCLRRRSEAERVPNEFEPHHGSLSKEIRQDVEKDLKGKSRVCTAVCTSTLEMGIDIGSVASVAQVGCPPSVAALRQRLGRSGRRPGDPSVLRMFLREAEIDERTPIVDQLRTGLVQSMAMVRLVLAGWCEPPLAQRLDYSTLVQQFLSMIAQHGGVLARQAFDALIANGPFENVASAEFADLLRFLGEREIIVQSSDDTILLGTRGEQIVNHHTFYAAFQTPEEYRVVAAQKTLGTLPINHVLVVGTYLIFAGRRWLILDVEMREKRIFVAPAPGGRVPIFDPKDAEVHDRVRREMLVIYDEGDFPPWLNRKAQSLLVEGRENFARLRISDCPAVREGNGTALFVYRGDRILLTLALALTQPKRRVFANGPLIKFEDADVTEVRDRLESLIQSPRPDPLELSAKVTAKVTDKYDDEIPGELLDRRFASRSIDVPGAFDAANEILNRWTD